MTEATEGAITGAGEQASMPVVTVPGEGNLSVTAAARALATVRHKPKDQPASEQRQEATPPAEQESTASADDAAAQTPPGETEQADPAAQDPGSEAGTRLPPIEPPRSWTKEDKELFAGLPRETQERLAERERSRDTDFSRRQNEAADKLKGLTAKEQAVEQARQHYESALPQLLQTLQQQQAGEFADVKSIQDVERLAREDWPRYLQWDLAQKKVAAVQQEMQAAQLRQHTEKQQKFAEFAKRQDDLFVEKVPDMADAKKMAALQSSAVSTLKAIGFDEAELGQAWQGQRDLSLRDHRVQLLIRDASLWRDAQAKAKAAATKPVPPVQRPGAAQPAGAQREQQIQNLDKRLEQSGSLKDGLALLRARRDASRASGR